MMRRFTSVCIFVGFFSAGSLTVSAQFMDSIKASFTHKPALDLRLDSRNSFISLRAARMFGIKLGLDYNGTVKIGLGYNQLLFEFRKELYIRDALDIPDTVDASLRFAYISPYFEYAFYKTKKWEISIPVQLGIGAARYEYEDNAGVFVKQKDRLVIMYEPAMTAQYRFIPWAGIGVGVGYRLVIVGNDALNENFNSPVYILRVKIFLRDIYRDVFPKKQK